MIEEEEKKALAPGGLDLGTSRLRGYRSNHFATTTAQRLIIIVTNELKKLTRSVVLRFGMNLSPDPLLKKNNYRDLESLDRIQGDRDTPNFLKRS